MTPDKQRLYDVFLAGTQAVSNLPTVDADWIDEILRGRFERWLDEHETSKGREPVCEPNEEMRRALGIARSLSRSNLS